MRSPAVCQSVDSESIRVRIPSPPLLCSCFNVHFHLLLHYSSELLLAGKIKIIMIQLV